MQVSIHEFKSHLAKYVGQAQSGQLVELTSHRKVVARLVGVPQTESTGVARLLAMGVATWQGGKPIGAAFALRAQGKLVSAMVLDDRG
ncbi:MAG TPA: type II toxin-antitoxin system prevent-host-death family antitoxin [Gallionella sp.]|nr:type II toxin-antitoxin system prevent-host-death family antitoxin [Gallionella sp.]